MQKANGANPGILHSSLKPTADSSSLFDLERGLFNYSSSFSGDKSSSLLPKIDFG